MKKDIFWSEEKQSERSIKTMLNPNGKSCKNCFFGQGHYDDFTTCGLHHVNFSIKSLCCSWVSLEDPEHKEYLKRRKDNLIKKFNHDRN